MNTNRRESSSWFGSLGFMALALVLLTACTGSSPKEPPAVNDYNAGMEAEAAGNLVLAREHYQRALTQARSQALGPSVEASCLYEWSRVTGYLRMYHEAEKGFLDVLGLVDRAGGTAESLRAPALAELARLLHDTGQHARALPFYDMAIAELQRLRMQMSDPVAFAEFLEEFAGSLRAAGLPAESQAVAQRAAALRRDHPGATPQFRARRYGANP